LKVTVLDTTVQRRIASAAAVLCLAFGSAGGLRSASSRPKEKCRAEARRYDGFGKSAAAGQESQHKEAGPVLKLSSASFEADGDVPVKYSCDGANVSPALAWTEAPAATQSFALIMDDPDVPAKTVVHWLIYDIPGGTRSLPEGVPTKKKLADGSEQGQNIRKKTGYTGPCPEKGGPAHHYFFKLYALDAKTGLKPNAKKEELEAAMKGHILAQAQVIGRFKH
jgi:Raf kinase inhibitor-like YbhB/YbcL family protein